MNKNTTPMDTPTGREAVPAAPHRLHGADRSGLGSKGWAETPDDLTGRPDDSNVPRDWFEPPALDREDPERGS
jgi:hypothetical protein